MLLYKGKKSRYRPGMVQRVGRGISLLSHDCGSRRGEWSAARPGRTLLLEKTRYPLGGWVGSRAGLDGRKISSPPGFFLLVIMDDIVNYKLFNSVTSSHTVVLCSFLHRAHYSDRITESL